MVEKSVFCVTSRKRTLKEYFGTGFVISRKGNIHYLITCAHVIERLGGKNQIKVGKARAKVIACGSGNHDDLAVLEVDFNNQEFPALKLKELEIKEGIKLKIRGYRKMDETHVKGEALRSKPTSDDPIDMVPIQEATEKTFRWKIKVEEKGSFSDLTYGYSGGPVYNEKNVVVAVATHQLEQNEGYIIPIADLKKICPWLYDECISYSQLPNKSKKCLDHDSLLNQLYLINYTRQRVAFFQAIKAHLSQVNEKKCKRPFLCFIPGENNRKFNGKFMKSLTTELERRNLLHNGAVCEPLELGNFQNVSDLREIMKDCLEKLYIPFEKLREQSYSKPIIFWVSLTARDWRRTRGSQIIDELVEFWSLLESQQHLFLICIFINYKENSLNSWFSRVSINGKIKKELAHLNSRLSKAENISGKVLEELSSFGKEDIENWLDNLCGINNALSCFIREITNDFFDKIKGPFFMNHLVELEKKLIEKENYKMMGEYLSKNH